MNAKRFVPLAVMTLLVWLTGCPDLTPVADIQLDEDDHGTAVLTPVGTKITVTLPSNVTTGYAWELIDPDTSILENTGQDYVAPLFGATGTGGNEVWEFTARAAGSATIRLEYRRSWEDDSIDPADTFQANVQVTDASL
ncbi:MAG: protease inhibitor I42 family protein [Phycisphaerae bacterium]|nr:protease inhibitor I42 family protein [Phycisphaerae bacterium]